MKKTVMVLVVVLVMAVMMAATAIKAYAGEYKGAVFEQDIVTVMKTELNTTNMRGIGIEDKLWDGYGLQLVDKVLADHKDFTDDDLITEVVEVDPEIADGNTEVFIIIQMKDGSVKFAFAGYGWY